MMKRSYLAFLVVFGACDKDHQLGVVDPADSGIDSLNSNTLPTSSDAGVSTQADLQVGPDAQAYVGSDAKAIGQLGPSQSWTGYIENYQFSSGSDAIKLTFAADSAGQVVGTVLFGNGTPPPQATDPNTGYPPGFAAMNTYTSGYWVEGFTYSTASGTAASSRLRFSVSSNELWSGWCALQTPIDDGGMCVPNWGGSCLNGQCSQTNPATGQTIDVDRGKFELCFMSHVCLCSTMACVADLSGGGASFDLTISGTNAFGSTAGDLGDHNVHFTKDP
jgi:hypothetical protein